MMLMDVVVDMNSNALEAVKYIVFILMIASLPCGLAAHFLMVNYLNRHIPSDEDKLYSLLGSDPRIMWKYYNSTKKNEGKVGLAFWFYSITIISFFILMIIFFYFVKITGG